MVLLRRNTTVSLYQVRVLLSIWRIFQDSRGLGEIKLPEKYQGPRSRGGGLGGFCFCTNCVYIVSSVISKNIFTF